MNKLATLQRIVLTLVLAFVSVNLWGQTKYSGDGTEGNPYQISNIFDWNTFAQAVTDGTNYSGKFFKLMNNITITLNSTDESDKIAGTWTSDSNYKGFSGTFDGNGKTITFNVGTAETPYNAGDVEKPRPTAPFSVIQGATIKNLYVQGTIYPQRRYNAGLVGFAFGSGNNINDCTSTINIDCSQLENTTGGGTAGNHKKWDASASGFVAENKSGSTLTFNNCIFDGSISKGSNDYANRGAGFVSYNNGNNISYTNCLMAGAIDLLSSFDATTLSTFARPASKNVYSDCLYCVGYGNVPVYNACEQAKTSANGVSKKYTVSGDNYYIPATVTPELHDMYYNNEPIVVSLSYYSKTLVKDTDYTILIKKKNGDVYETVSEIAGPDGANYKVTLTGKTEGGYDGSKEYSFKFLSEDGRWQNLVDILTKAGSGSTITLSNDYIADPASTDAALTIPEGKTLTINLNNHTIDRNLSEAVNQGQVIRIEAGATLNIVGPGTITGGYNLGSEGDIDGGGIFNAGTLTLNNVTVTNNKCVKKSDVDASGRGGGIYTGPGSSFTMNGGAISYNIAQGGGGGIFGNDANVFVITGTSDNYVSIDNNYSDSKGGGVRVKTTSGKSADLTYCHIELNSVTAQEASTGGGIQLDDGTLNLQNCLIENNKSTWQGAGLYNLNGTTTAKDCIFRQHGPYGDSPKQQGGGVCIYNGSFKMDGGSIYYNNSNGYGSGIYVNKGASLYMKGDVGIYDNWKSGLLGGAAQLSNIYFEDYEKGVIKIEGGLTNSAGTKIGVSKNYSTNFNGVFTSGLKTNSVDISIFASDNAFHVGTNEDETEGKLSIINEWKPGAALPEGITNNGSGSYTVTAPVGVVNGNIEANSISFTSTGYLIIEDGGTLTVPTITNTTPIRLVLEEGGQIITNTEVDATVKKNVASSFYYQSWGKWYLISSAIKTPLIYDATNATTLSGEGKPSYDLYRFNETAELQWENYRNTEHDDFTTFENGRGYLYRNLEDHAIEMMGKLNVSSVSYDLSFSGSGDFNGFNIIGNPYSHNIKKGDGQAIPNTYLEDNYYVLNTNEGKFDLTTDGTIIPPLTGILVQANSASTLTISKIVASASKDAKADDNNIWFTISNNEYEDRACVKFKEGHGLNKIEHLNEEAPMLYIHHNGESFASVDMNHDVKAFDLNFEAKTFGKYTLSVKASGEYGYLHLIDKVAGKDVDLLAENEYTFIGSSADNADRFIVRLEISENAENPVFAYQSRDEIIVSGEGELQVFDVMGRLVAKQYVNGVGTWHAASVQTGVYILRLNEKTQKIIVR